MRSFSFSPSSSSSSSSSIALGFASEGRTGGLNWTIRFAPAFAPAGGRSDGGRCFGWGSEEKSLEEEEEDPEATGAGGRELPSSERTALASGPAVGEVRVCLGWGREEKREAEEEEDDDFGGGREEKGGREGG